MRPARAPRSPTTPRGCRAVALALLVATLVAPGSVRARSLATVDRDHADDVAITAPVPVPAIPDGADVVVHLGTLTLRAPADALRRRGRVLTFDAGSGAVGLARLRVDLRRGRVGLRAAGIVLPLVAGPIVLRVGTDEASGCTMLRAVPLRPRRGTTTRFRLARDVGPCALPDPPRASPGTLVAGVPTTVHFTVAAPVDVDAGSLRVQRLDARGKATTDAPLCTVASGAAGCDATLTETGSGPVTVAVHATADGRPVTSPAMTLLVASPVTPADLEVVGTVQQRAQTLWQEAKARLGDSLDARMATLTAVRRLPGVEGAALSPDGDDLVFRYASGILGVLILSAPAEDGPIAAPSSAPRHAVPRAAADTGACPPTRRFVGDTRALIFDPGFFASSEAPAIAAMLDGSCVHFDVTVLQGADASVAGLAAASDYGTLVLDTHGAVDWNGRVVFATADLFATVSGTYAALFQSQTLIAGSIDDPRSPPRAIVTPDFVATLPLAMSNGIVWGGFCWSRANASLADAFWNKGARAYFGFDRSVSTRYAAEAGTSLFTGLVPRFQTTGEAGDAVSPKVDPYGVLASRGVRPRGLVHTPPPLKRLFARFGRVGDADVAYVGVARLTPAAGAVDPGGDETVTATVERAEDCAFRFHWHTSASAGHLANADGIDDFESTRTTATYTANADAPDTTDTLRAEVHPPEDAGAPDTLVAAACGTVAVGALPTTLEIVFDGTGTWSQTTSPSLGSVTFTATAQWHSVHHLSLPQLEPFGIQNANDGTTVTGTSTISGASGCSGALVVNTSHGQGVPPPQAQTPFLVPLFPSSPHAERFALDVMGGYDYRLCDGEYNIGVGPWAAGSPDLPGYAGAPLFAQFTFDRDAFAHAPPHAQEFPVSLTEHASGLIGTADVTWSGTITLTSQR